jgi:hypothetical protein
VSDQPSHVQQAINELASAEESGDVERVKAARKRLAAAGVDEPKARAEAPKDRRSKQEQQQKTADAPKKSIG